MCPTLPSNYGGVGGGQAPAKGQKAKVTSKEAKIGTEITLKS